MRVPFGSLPDTILETILGAFGVPLASLGESLWEKRESGKASKKWSEKQECGKIREGLGGTPFVPINNHSSSLVGHSLPNVGVLLAYFATILDSIIALHFVLRILGHGGGFLARACPYKSSATANLGPRS